MSAEKRQITHASMSVSHDPGHGGDSYQYRIDANGENHKVTLTITGSYFPRHKPLPRFGEDIPMPPRMEEILVKEKHQVEEFLRKLSEEFGVFELTDLKTMHWLHPSYYSFGFQDSSGAEHVFSYMIDCSHHIDERYKRVVEAFDVFFEVERISRKFYEQVEKPKEQKWLERKKQERAKKRWWKFW
jgi:hypothetical protein